MSTEGNGPNPPPPAYKKRPSDATISSDMLPAKIIKSISNNLSTLASKSFDDVEACLEQARKSTTQLDARSGVVNNTGRNLLPDGFRAQQYHEDDVAQVVVVFAPVGTSLMMGGLHPRASLYERPINLTEAQACHKAFRDVLRQQGVTVLTVREVLSHGADTYIGSRLQLEDMGMEALTYKLREGVKLSDVGKEDQYYVSDEYKRSVLSVMSVEQLIEAIFLNPTVILQPTGRDTGLSCEYEFSPLSNLVYTRDQQICTCNGIVMGNLKSVQRQLEIKIMKFVFQKLGLSIQYEVKSPGYLEGGDYVPIGKSLALLGVGLRSNYEAAKQLMDNDALGTDRFGVVKDKNDQAQDRMHLDCCFGIVSERMCIMYEPMMGAESPIKRLVDEYVRNEGGKGYTLTRQDVEFSEFMRGEGYTIIPISKEQQLKYGCNVLNLGKGNVLAVDDSSARTIACHPQFKGQIQVVPFDQITSMYGAVHCASQVLLRRRK